MCSVFCIGICDVAITHWGTFGVRSASCTCILDGRGRVFLGGTCICSRDGFYTYARREFVAVSNACPARRSRTYLLLPAAEAVARREEGEGGQEYGFLQGGVE